LIRPYPDRAFYFPQEITIYCDTNQISINKPILRFPGLAENFFGGKACYAVSQKLFRRRALLGSLRLMKPVKEILHTFTRFIILALIAMMMLAVLLSTVELLIILVIELLKPPKYLLGIENLFEIFGFFMMILIGLELLESIRTYLTDDLLHVEVVFLVAMIAIARKVIILEVKGLDPLVLIGIACIILALSLGYYFVKKAIHLNKVYKDTQGSRPA
jgi:uncharacterized membrane protein (DUF373 family)